MQSVLFSREAPLTHTALRLLEFLRAPSWGLSCSLFTGSLQARFFINTTCVTIVMWMTPKPTHLSHRATTARELCGYGAPNIITNWMGQNLTTKLQLNKDKTEIIVFGAENEWLKVGAHLDSLSLKVKSHVRNLGVNAILAAELAKIIQGHERFSPSSPLYLNLRDEL